MKLHKYPYLNKIPSLPNRMTRPSGLQFFEIVNRMGVHPVLILKKIQIGRLHPVLNPADQKILKFAVDSPQIPNQLL